MGHTISGGFRTAGSPPTVVETATLTFDEADDRSAYTVEFVVTHAPGRPASLDGVVDLILTENVPVDATPELTVQIDDEPLPLTTRLRSRRAFVATIPVAEFDRMTRAGAVSDRALDVTLRFGPGQLAMLRTMADRWFGR